MQSKSDARNRDIRQYEFALKLNKGLQKVRQTDEEQRLRDKELDLKVKQTLSLTGRDIQNAKLDKLLLGLEKSKTGLCSLRRAYS